MSESDAPIAAPAPGSRPRRRFPLPSPSTIVVLLTIVLVVLAWADNRRRLRDLREQVSRAHAQTELEVREARGSAKKAEDGARADAERLRALEERVGRATTQQAWLEALYNDRSRSNEESMLAEIEQSLNIGAQQLQLAGNVQAALFAVQSADARLALANRAQFTDLRASFLKDINALKAVPHVDLTGMVLRLDSIVGAVDEMTLLADGRPQPEADPAAGGTTVWTRIGELVWNEIRQLVRVQRLDGADQALLTPEAASYLRENLKLRLLGARLALLQRNDAVFRGDAVSARKALEKYFDRRQKDVAEAIATLSGFERASLSVELPKLDQSIAKVRGLRSTLDKPR